MYTRWRQLARRSVIIGCGGIFAAGPPSPRVIASRGRQGRAGSASGRAAAAMTGSGRSLSTTTTAAVAVTAATPSVVTASRAAGRTVAVHVVVAVVTTVVTVTHTARWSEGVARRAGGSRCPGGAGRGVPQGLASLPVQRRPRVTQWL